MAKKLKDLFFFDKFIEQLGQAVQQVYPDFDRETFRSLTEPSI